MQFPSRPLPKFGCVVNKDERLGWSAAVYDPTDPAFQLHFIPIDNEPLLYPTKEAAKRAAVRSLKSLIARIESGEP